jgi:hypothetical protein
MACSIGDRMIYNEKKHGESECVCVRDDGGVCVRALVAKLIDLVFLRFFVTLPYLFRLYHFDTSAHIWERQLGKEDCLLLTVRI